VNQTVPHIQADHRALQLGDHGNGDLGAAQGANKGKTDPPIAVYDHNGRCAGEATRTPLARARRCSDPNRG